MTTAEAGLSVAVWARMRELVLDRNDRRKEAVEALGMSFLKVKALRHIALRSQPMRELTLELSIDKPYTTLIVDDLEQRGLVERSVAPDDRRCKIVTATPAGLEAAQLAERILTKPPAAVAALPAADLAELNRILALLD
jgi:DNA-binding MarR family transcriptional regulator